MSCHYCSSSYVVLVLVCVETSRYPAEERRIRRMLLQHRFIGESVISGADTLYDIALSEVGSFEELPGMHYVIPPGFESVIDILRKNVPPSCLLLQHVVTNISWNNSTLCKLTSSYISPTLVCFNGYFPGGPGLAGTRMSLFWIVIELRMMEVMVTIGAIRRAKLQSKCHHQQTSTKFFYRPDALPVAQPTA